MRQKSVFGDSVYLRPPSGRCDEEWSGPHRITSVNSAVSVIINDDGVSRHVSHLRAVPQFSAGEDEDSFVRAERRGDAEIASQGESDEGLDDQEQDAREEPVRRSTRTKRPPVWHSDYVM